MIERRKQDLDPVDVYSAETWALLKLCGAVRKSDLEDAPSQAASAPMADRRREDRRREDRRRQERRGQGAGGGERS